jgi:hypothetical protein
MFSELCGFKARELSALPTAIKYALEIKNLLIVSSLLFCAYSVFYLFQLITVSITTAIIITLFTVVLLFCLQNLIISASGMGCEKDSPSNNALWRPASLRIYIFFVVALIFSQPLLLALYSQIYESEINQSIDEQKNLRQEFLQNSLKIKEDNLNAQLSRQHEILERLTGISLPNTIVLPPNQITTTLETNTSHRKAILIGNQAYPTAALFNSDRDAKDMSKALTEIGFSTLLITDGTKATMETEIHKYIETIEPGDISYFYYSGHGLQNRGQNYIIPVDYSGNNAIGINFIIEEISKKHPTASVITIDACRKFNKGDNGGLASLEAGSSGTYISLAAKPGQTASDGKKGGNGVFTGAILKHIREPIDIDAIFRKVIDEVTKATQDKQEPWINHNLHGTLILSTPDYKLSPLAANNNTQLAQTKSTQTGRIIPLTRGVTIEEEVSNEYITSEGTQAPSCEQKASKLPLADIKNFLINCNQKRLLQLEDQLATHKLATQKAIAQLNDDMLYTNPFAYTLTADLYYLKKHPTFLILGTIALTALLLLGFLMREIKFSEMSAYEQLLNYHLKNFVSEKFREAKHVTSLLPYTPDEALRNAPSSPYLYHDFDETKTQDGSVSADFFSHLNSKTFGESI